MNDPVQEEADRAVKEAFAKINERRQNAPPRPPPQITSDKTALVSQGGFMPTTSATIPDDPLAPGGGTIDVTSVDSADESTPVDEVDNVNRLTFEMTDPDTPSDHLEIADNGDGEAIVKFPTTTITGAVNGVPSTLVIVTDGTPWEEI